MPLSLLLFQGSNRLVTNRNGLLLALDDAAPLLVLFCERLEFRFGFTSRAQGAALGLRLRV